MYNVVETPSPTQIILLTYDQYKIPVDELFSIASKIKEEFPLNEVICIPSAMNFDITTKKQLVQSLIEDDVESLRFKL